MPNYLQHIYRTTTKRGKVVAVLDDPITTQDHDADAFIVTVSDAVFSGGSAYGDFVRADGVTIPLSGSISGDTATVILAPNCYTVSGRFFLTVKVEASGSKTTYLQVDGYAKPSSTDEFAVAGDDSAPIDVILEAAEKAEQVLSAVAGKAPAIPVNASGDIVTITDGAEGMPVQALTTNIAPAEDGSGWDSVSVTCAGKNLFGGETLADRFQSVMSVTRDDEARTISFHASSASGKVFFTDFKPGTRYTIILYGRNGSGQTNTYIRYTDGTTGKPLFVESATDCYAVYTTAAGKSVEAFMGSYSNGTTVLYYDKCGIFEGVLTEADFAEYQGKTLNAALPETVTEGVYDWVNGVLTKPDGSTVQLTPQQMDTLKGVNNIWSNAGETVVTYAADTKLYIDGKIAAIATAILNE